MKIKKIVVSGANEYTEIGEMFALARTFPFVEFGIQVSGFKAAMGTSRWRWLQRLITSQQKGKYHLNLALHLNQDWVESFCEGRPCVEVESLLAQKYSGREPVFQRVQLNFKVGREKTPDLDALERLIHKYLWHRFILSDNESNAAVIKKLHGRHLRFDCLYDSSHGEGISAKEWKAPRYKRVFQGYAGGLSPENIRQELDRIAAVVPEEREIFIDAEGRLKDPGSGHLDLRRCWQFALAVTKWHAPQEQ
jgi:hypothetical protein